MAARTFSYKDRKPFYAASVVFLVCCFALFLIGIVVDLSTYEMKHVVFFVSLLCITLFARNIYDTLRIESLRGGDDIAHTDDYGIGTLEWSTELYEKSPVPYLILDSNGVVCSANLAAHRLFLCARGNLKGVEVFNTLSSEKEHHIEVLTEKYKKSISISDETVLVKRQKGSDAWVLLSLFQFKRGRERFGLLTLVDITKQKQVEHAKSEFVSLASHQLRTPIAGIKWSAELLQLDNPDALTVRQKKYIDRLLIGANRMAVLVDDFLRVSRFELGTFQPEYSSVQLVDLIQEVAAEFSVRLNQKKITLETFFDTSVVCVVTDQNLLRMILTNLLSNAVKYTKENGTIHVGYCLRNTTIVLSVADNGMGIPIADQDRIFQKLFRASNAVRCEPDGTGLGLYIVKEAVEVLKGSISFSSVEHMSTTFEVVLPLHHKD